MTRCGICQRDIATAPPSEGTLGVPVCARCYGAQITIRIGLTPGIFEVASFGDSKRRYVVTRERQQMVCDCPWFGFRDRPLALPCKHVTIVRLLAKAAGGWRQLQQRNAGLTIRFKVQATEEASLSR